jgi:hypothetical protein
MISQRSIVSAASFSLVLVLGFGCGSSSPDPKRPTDVWVPDETDEENIKMSAAKPAARSPVARHANPEPAVRPALASADSAQPDLFAEPEAEEEPSDPDDTEAAAAQAKEDQGKASKRSKKAKRSKKGKKRRR